MSEWPKTVVIGLSRVEDEQELRYPWGQIIDVADWSFVRTAYRLGPDGSREEVAQFIIDSFNRDLRADMAQKPPAETQNAMFDRVKREAHERRALENEPSPLPQCFRDAVSSTSVALERAMNVPAPHEVPLLAGPRLGMER